MKIILAPDSFKGSLSAHDVCLAMERGVLKIFPDATVISLPLADGGEGTVETLVSATSGKFISVPVTDPLGNTTRATYGIMGGRSQTAIIEMASASGLTLIPEKRRNPYFTTSYGTGELIKHALDNNYKKIIVSIGGSATNDGGTGMLQALGVEFFDKIGKPVNDFMTNKKMGIVDEISIKNFHPKIKDTTFIIACDVDNLLLGPKGSTYIYGRQKGAHESDLPVMEENMENFYNLAEKELNIEVRNTPGSGAAGGLGAAFLSFFNAKLVKGIDLVLESINFKDRINNSDFVLTGEGSIDEQTSYGKVISGVLKIARQQKVPVVALAGSIKDLDKLYPLGLSAALSICNSPMEKEKSMEKAEELITLQTEQICRLLQIR